MCQVPSVEIALQCELYAINPLLTHAAGGCQRGERPYGICYLSHYCLRIIDAVLTTQLQYIFQGDIVGLILKSFLLCYLAGTYFTRLGMNGHYCLGLTTSGRSTYLHQGLHRQIFPG